MADVTWNGTRLATGQAVPAGPATFQVVGATVTALVVSTETVALGSSASASVTVDLRGLAGPTKIRFAARNGRSTVGNYDRVVNVVAPAVPSAHTTGVPAGVTLVEAGTTDVFDGSVLVGLHITGGVNNRSTQAGGGATIRNCRIDGPVHDAVPNAGHLALIDTEVDGIVRLADVTGLRLYLHGGNDLWTPILASDLFDSYLTMPIKVAGLHPDCAQFNQGHHAIHHCVFDAWGTYSVDERVAINSCIQVTADQGECFVTVEESQFRGGNFSVNLKTQDDAWLTVSDSSFGEARYGPVIARTDRVSLTDNTYVAAPLLL